MHYWRHEHGEDPYASGNENRRHNRDRLHREVELRDNLRRMLRGGYGSPLGGDPGHPFGYGPGGHGFGPMLNMHRQPFGHAGFPEPRGLGFFPSPYDDDLDSDDEALLPWHTHAMPPWHANSRHRLSPSGRQHVWELRNPWTQVIHGEHYQRMPRPPFPHGYHRM